MSDSQWPHGLLRARLPCPSLSPRVCSNSHPLSQGCHKTISSSVTPLLLLSVFPSMRVFFNKSTLHITWPKYWSFSFSISSSSECSELISFRINRFDLILAWCILYIRINMQCSSISPVLWFSHSQSSLVFLSGVNRGLSVGPWRVPRPLGCLLHTRLSKNFSTFWYFPNSFFFPLCTR